MSTSTIILLAAVAVAALLILQKPKVPTILGIPISSIGPLASAVGGFF